MSGFVTTNRTFVGELDQFPAGSLMTVTHMGRDVVVARIGEQIYAVDGRCPHLGGHLGRGRLNGRTIVCPLHGSQFDLASGEPLRWTSASGVLATLVRWLRRPRALTRYAVILEDGQIYLGEPIRSKI